MFLSSLSRGSLEPGPRRVFRNATRLLLRSTGFLFEFFGRRFLSPDGGGGGGGPPRTLSQKLRSCGCFAKFQPRIFAAPLQLVKGELVSWFRHVSSTKCPSGREEDLDLFLSTFRSPLSATLDSLPEEISFRFVLGSEVKILVAGYFSSEWTERQRLKREVEHESWQVRYGIYLKIKFSGVPRRVGASRVSEIYQSFFS